MLSYKQAARLQARADERRKEQDGVAQDAAKIWNARDAANNSHPYLVAKQVEPHGLKISQDGKSLLVPMRNAEGELRGLQAIDADGQKNFMKGMEKKGCFHVVGTEDGKLPPKPSEIGIAEGYATAASIHAATHKTVAVAFDAGNLEPVARAIREKCPDAEMTIYADNDHTKEQNIGVEKAVQAAKAVSGTVMVPDLTPEEKAQGMNDYNDIMRSRGEEALRAELVKSSEHMREKEIALAQEALKRAINVETEQNGYGYLAQAAKIVSAENKIAQIKENSVLPLYNAEGELRGLQSVDIQGSFHVVGTKDAKLPDSMEKIQIARDYESAAALAEATKHSWSYKTRQSVKVETNEEIVS